MAVAVPFLTAIAPILSAGIGLGGTALAAKSQEKSQKKAIKSQERSSAQALEVQKESAARQESFQKTAEEQRQQEIDLSAAKQKEVALADEPRRRVRRSLVSRGAARPTILTSPLGIPEEDASKSRGRTLLGT